MTSAIARLNDFGQSPWLDNLTRGMARGGELARLVADDGIRGVTSNPSIFEKAMGSGDDYDAELAELTRGGATIEEVYWALVVGDVSTAADVLRPTHDRLGGADGFVSLEVSPDIAGDTTATVAQVAELAGRVDRPNLMVKIPATEAGLPAIEEGVAAGLNINITLIFALGRYDAVVEAYLRGLERRVEAGLPVDAMHSVASFFVSRVDTETDKRLPEGHPLRGRAAVANAKIAYQHFLEHFRGPRWEALAAHGATLQRPLWASTSTKNPAYSPTLYVDTLIGENTINTLAPPSVEALRSGQGHQEAGSILEGVDDARAVLDGLAEAGVSYDDVTATLEHDGVAAFSRAFHDCLDSLAKRAAELTS